MTGRSKTQANGRCVLPPAIQRARREGTFKHRPLQELVDLLAVFGSKTAAGPWKLAGILSPEVTAETA